MFEQLKQYNSLIVDYSFIREFGGTALLSDLLDFVTETRKDVYVSKSFKLFHYCVLHQADDKTASATSAMRDFCTVLLQDKLLHSVQATETCDFLDKVSTLENSCIIMARDGIFSKRIKEKMPAYIGDILVIDKAKEFTICHGVAEFITQVPDVEISPLASLDKYLDAPIYCNVGDTIQTGNNTSITLEKRISAGAEGMVFTTNNPKYVAKIYHKGIITPLRWKKLQVQVEMGLNSVGLCWPQELLFFKGIPVGYTMITGKGKTMGNVFDGPDALLNSFPDWKRIDITTSLCDLLEKYMYLHMHGIVAGDIQMKNSLLYSSNSIYLIDMDSVQVANLPCPVGTEEFTDPRLWGLNFSSFLRKLEDEDYSIAMLVFSLLFCGLHPYATRNGAETLREEILEKNFPYTLDNSDEEHIPKGGYNYIWRALPVRIREMLYNTFKLGQSYEAIEWYDAVLTYKESLVAGTIEDEEAYKAFPNMDYKATEPNPVSSSKFTPKTFSPASSVGKAAAAKKGFKSAVTTVDSNNPFAAVANSGNSSSPLAATPRTSSGIHSGYGGNASVGQKKPEPTPVVEEKKNGGLFNLFKKG
ncbi:MAG: hypothetical protein MJ094_05485 [Saccharofermentans sp.]|nr:hypothetical protein [Saccharofermentans sp.]